VANRPWILKDLIVVTAFVGLVPEEVNGGILDSIRLLGVGFKVLQAVRLIPSGWEDVKRYLASNGVAISRLLNFDHIGVVIQPVLRCSGASYVKPKSANFSRRTFTNVSRTL
jgi:hypothetical protein